MESLPHVKYRKQTMTRESTSEAYTVSVALMQSNTHSYCRMHAYLMLNPQALPPSKKAKQYHTTVSQFVQ